MHAYHPYHPYRYPYLGYYDPYWYGPYRYGASYHPPRYHHGGAGGYSVAAPGATYYPGGGGHVVTRAAHHQPVHVNRTYEGTTFNITGMDKAVEPLGQVGWRGEAFASQPRAGQPLGNMFPVNAGV